MSALLAGGISIVSLGMSVINFVSAKKTETIKGKLEIDRLCGLAYDFLFGDDGFEKTQSHDAWDQAHSLIIQASRINPKSSKVVRYQGLLPHVMGNKEAAAERYRSAIRLDPGYVNAYRGLAGIVGGVDGLNYLKTALKYDPRDAWIWCDIGVLLQKLRTEDFMPYLREAEHLHPNDQKLLIACARCWNSASMPKEARRLFSKAVSLNKSNVDALVGLGSIAIGSGEWEDGMMWIEDAVRVNPTDSYPYAMVAAIYADQGNAEKSLEYCQKAITIDPSRRVEGDNIREMTAAMHSLILAAASATPEGNLPISSE